jgi:hypothetical protein
MSYQKQKYDAALLQQQQTATAQQQKLQESTQQLHDVQRQLAEAQAALSDARRQRDDAVQMQQSVQEQFGVLHTTHKVRAQKELAGLIIMDQAWMRHSGAVCDSKSQYEAFVMWSCLPFELTGGWSAHDVAGYTAGELSFGISNNHSQG